MINPEARIKLAQYLRDLIDGKISNFEYIDLSDELWPQPFFRERDFSIWCIKIFGWHLFDDSSEYKLLAEKKGVF